MSLTLAAGRPTLADRVIPRRLATDIALVAGGALLTAGAAQLAIPLWPVPITGQTFAVLLVGTVLGSSRGLVSMLLYVALGLVGLPVFTPQADGSHVTGLAALVGPTGGYLVGFVLAAAFVGWLAQRQWDHKVLRTAVAFLGGSAIMYALGLPWLYVSLVNLGTPDALAYTVQHGLLVFLPGDAIKAVVAAAALPLAWKALGSAPR